MTTSDENPSGHVPGAAGAAAARPSKADPATLRLLSQAVHAGNSVDPGSGAIRTPIVTANSYALPEDPSTVNWSGTDIPLYSRNGGVNQHALQDKLAALEQAEAAAVFASGVAALHAVFFTFLKAGDHVVVSDTTYEATWRLFAELLPEKYGIRATFVDVSDARAFRAAVTADTALVVVEAIANPTTKVTDIALAAEVAHSVGARLVVDSTFTPPPLHRPLQDGADLVVHSLTKFINGHGDAMGGAVLGAAELIRPILGEAVVDVGGVISPFNAWLISRGAITLPLRLRQHLAGAQRVAEFLAAHPKVAYVAYPGLPEHPQHELAQRQFGGRGYGSIIAFAVAGDPDTQNRFVSQLRLVTSAVSLGHDESLIVHVGTAGPRVATYPEDFRRYGHLRFSVGLEDPADLIADLEAALAATFPG